MKIYYKILIERIKGLFQEKNLKLNTVEMTSNCDQNNPYDFYCDAEKPFIPS